MWQIRRIYLDSIGTAAGRFPGVTIDLADGRGRPLDSILWLRNGGGKSTIMALLGALMRPRRDDFLSAAEHRNDAGRHLEDYVLGGDTAHIAVEWRESDGRRLVTGAVCEWIDRTMPIDPTASHDRLNQRWYSFIPDGERAELDRLPFRRRETPTDQEAFCSAIRALPPATEPVVTKLMSDWTRTLAARGIDPDLWRTILQMNESEGGIEHQFIYADADEFVKDILRLIIDPEIPASVAKILGQVAVELAARPAVEADLRFCVGAMAKLAELDAAYTRARDAAELVRVATADARTLQAALMSAALEAEARQRIAKAAQEAAAAEVTTHRATADVARDTANEYTRLAAVLREEAADARIEALEGELADARLERDAWQATRQVAELGQVVERRETLATMLEAAQTDAAPLATRRLAAAATYLRALDTLTESATAGAEAADQEAKNAHEAMESARERHAVDLREVADERSRGQAAKAAVERFERDLANARTAGSIGPDETAAAAVERLVAADADDEARGRLLTDELAAATSAVARDRTARDELVSVEARAQLEASTARGTRDDILARRDDLAGDPRLARYLPDDDVELLSVGRTVRDAISETVRRADSALVDLALDGADDARALESIEATGYLPPTPDLARAGAILAEAGISAVTGWAYFADVMQVPARRAAALLAAPDLVFGLLVQDPSQVGKARELLADAGIRPTSLVAVATTADLEAAADGSGSRHFALAPNSALYDASRAEEERERREAARAGRSEQRERTERERDEERALGARLDALLAECPPERLAALDAEIVRLDGIAADLASDLAGLERRITDGARDIEQHQLELAKLTQRRALNDRARVRAEALRDAEVTVAGDREILAAHPAALAKKEEAAAASDAAERNAAGQETAAKLRAAALQADLADYANRRAGLPGETDPRRGKLSAGWSLDVVAAAYADADQAWFAATAGSPIAAELGTVKARESALRDELAAKPAQVVARANELLGSPDGASPAARERAGAAATDRVDELGTQLGAAKADKEEAHREATDLALSDRQRHRVVERPASVEAAKAAAAVAKREQEVATEARGLAEERTRREERRASEAEREAEGFSDQAAKINVPDEAGAPEEVRPFAGTVEEARAKAAEVSRSLAMLRRDEDEDRRALEALGASIALWAGRDDWSDVKAEVRSRFRTTEVAAELGPIAASFREDIDLRRVEIEAHLATLDSSRANVIGHGVGMVKQALRAITRFSTLSKLPEEELGAWGGQRFIDVGPRQVVDVNDEGAMRDRVGRAVDELIRGGNTIGGNELLWRAVREVVGPSGFRAKVLKPSPTFSTERISVDRMRKWSGGEKVTMALLLFVTVAQLRAANRGKELAGAGALVLDNPLGKANYVLFLDLQRRVARAAGVQLVFLTGVADMKAVGLFPNVVRMRNAPDRSRRRSYVEVVDRDVRAEDEIASVDATRVYRVDDTPSMTLA